MNTTTLLGRLRHYFSPSVTRYDSEAVAVIERSLRETSDLFRSQINTTNALRAELQYLYHILLRRTRCNFKIYFANSPHVYLFTFNHDAKGTDILVYAPRGKAEIAELYTHAAGNALAIDELVLDDRYCDTHFGGLLLGELSALAQQQGLERITGRFGRAAAGEFQALAAFLQNAGFHVRILPGQQTAEISYVIRNEA